MLVLEIPEREVYLEKENTFKLYDPVLLKLEHSLLSISKWEAKWKKPFLDPKTRKSHEESIDYIRCMTLNQNVDPDVYSRLTSVELEKVNAYINDELTATTFSSPPGRSPNRQVVTSELIYYWMAGYGIPFECQKWHISRLLTLLRIFDIKSGKQKKMSKSEIISQNKMLNDARRKAAKSRG